MKMIKCDKCGDVIPATNGAHVTVAERWTATGCVAQQEFDLCLGCLRLAEVALGRDDRATGLLEGMELATARGIALRNVLELAGRMVTDADATVRECGLSMIVFCKEAGIEPGGNV